MPQFTVGLKSVLLLGNADLIACCIETIVLPLGEDPPAITSVCLNHNGKILAASATDGMIHIYAY
ncbi:hypothetical protein E2562_010313 [Oryza meyeriana var. granulata]|uniref:Anaphase-promoting complex subunit 4 WD40 domain-containing protein n=1 Tax=Oryza meyeriana var. granulata TaxID=110450 RepID=A0A6G1F655_9ORYZ|nr:hypothetical protein E2562_010313 [Oryza meyeriana var. granulata]